MSEHHDRRRYGVRHVTDYTYRENVTQSFGRAMLRPRDTAQQRVLEHSVTISPEPDHFDESMDAFGNFTHYIEISAPHTRLTVTKESTIEVEWPAPDLTALDRWTIAEAAERIATTPECDPFEVSAFRFPSSQVTFGREELALAAEVLTPEMPLGQALTRVHEQIHTDFTYSSGATTVATTLPEVIEARAGVCQDFAHLAAMYFRSVGIPCRYVSGYIETYPAPGQEKLEGSDASHAWVSVLTPTGTWVDIDPTNNQVADSRYLVTSWGRDFRDVSPLKGIIFSDGGGSTLDVGVTVTRLDDPGS